MEILKKLFVNWELDTWANVLEVVGFASAIGGFVIGIFTKSELNKLKTRYIFDRRINDHLKNLRANTTELNNFLNDYNNNRQQIRTELSVVYAELKDLIPKLTYWQAKRCRRLKRFISQRRKKEFVAKGASLHPFIMFVTKYPKRLYKTTYDDIWIIYDHLIGVIREIENIKKNNAKVI